MDPWNINDSTWTFEFTSTQTNYTTLFPGSAGFVSDSVSLTITGAANNDYNGTYALTENSTTDFGIVMDIVSGDGLVNGIRMMKDSDDGSSSAFTFGSPAVSVTGFYLNGTPASEVGVGEVIDPSDLLGITLGGDGFINGASYTYTGSVIAVPEPSAFAGIFGLVALLAARRRNA